ncbi:MULTISPECIES: rRNA maturation RNase YbeY [Polaribacter]|uniref:Endoribonuclease YbeY n=1 Tax=Polaribacter butkevichii TaxID=218490 RepID=A0A2P6C760_9FLAO|nr:rRNA maturation RNase YbeY [Polaribacter butkevichii]PQJ68732.1 rRNA maturation RNase YbeY [Polaribacter butkevichii]
MVTFNYETEFELKDENLLEYWIDTVVSNKGFSLGELNYIFCDDEYLHKLNVEFLQHDTLTDVISFDNTLGKLISGDIYISVERVADNAKDFEVSFVNELHRVMIHGVLHYMGLKDKTEEEKKVMRNAEDEALSQFK